MAASPHFPTDDARQALLDVLRGPRLEARFQPIVDLVTATPIGYEVLCRPTVGRLGIEALFLAAKAHALSWDLERACRVTALSRIAELPAATKGLRYFLNVSPDILSDPRFIEGFTRTQLSRYGIQQEDIVIEITERESVQNYELFERLLRHYEAQGFQIALDDFGSGHSSLVTLISSVPHYLKLDKELVRDVHRRPYKQRLVRSLVSFAAGVETRLIAEGIEKWEELELLSRLGVRFGQGYLFARPEALPPPLPGELRQRLLDVRRRNDSRQSVLSATVLHLLDRCPTVAPGELTCEQLDDLFLQDGATDHAVVVNGDRPIGLLTRQHVLLRTAGPVGRSLFARKPAETLAKGNALTVPGSASVAAVARLALDRTRQDSYDPVVVTDDGGERFLGTVTVKQLLACMSELSEHEAAGANALTGLPGQRTIDKWLQHSLGDDFTIVFADLDRFREFNEVYGFLAGDELIGLTAAVLQEVVRNAGPHAKLGHVGADDFVIVSPGPMPDLVLEHACAAFDRRRLEYFSAEDGQRGTMLLPPRRGRGLELPLTALSLAVVSREHFDGAPHPGHLAQVGISLKRKLKELTRADGRSRTLRERRRHVTQGHLDGQRHDSIPPSLLPDPRRQHSIPPLSGTPVSGLVSVSRPAEARASTGASVEDAEGSGHD